MMRQAVWCGVVASVGWAQSQRVLIDRHWIIHRLPFGLNPAVEADLSATIAKLLNEAHAPAYQAG